MTPKIDRVYLLETLRDLVRINSINPSLEASGPGEAEISGYVMASLTRIGLQTHRYEPVPGRVSVVGKLPGSGGGRSLMLNAHYDTVGVAGMPDPFGGHIADGKLFGRGAYDMKGSLAAGMAAAKVLADTGAKLRGDLLVAAVADEEYSSIGTADLCERVKVDAAIVTEPSALRVCLAHKGYLWITVEVVGHAAHGSKFDLGVDANMRMGRFLAALETLERDLRARTPHHLVGPPSLHAATLTGGSGLSTYAARCVLQIERRTVPGETEQDVMAELQAIIDRLHGEDPSFEASLKAFFVRDPFEVDRSAEIVASVGRAATMALGHEPEYYGDTPWMDAALLAAAGVETVVIGPAGGGAHSKVEWVDLTSVEKLAEILAIAALDYCA